MDNKQRLGSVLAGRMTKTSREMSPVCTELGTIGANGALSTDSLQTPIPKGEYMVDSRLKCETYNTSKTTHSHNGGNHGGHDSGSGTHTHTDGEHTHRLPDNFRGLQAGDRVLVVWCGNEPIVTAIVVSS